MSIIRALNLLGLILTFVGTICIYVASVDAFIKLMPSKSTIEKINGKDEEVLNLEIDYNKITLYPDIRLKLAKWRLGLILLAIGFFIQLIALWLDP